jgi:RNA polymerase sigma-70 factor, ECF subfamily
MISTLAQAADPAANDQSSKAPARPAAILRGEVRSIAAAAPEGDELATALPILLPRLWRFALRLAGDRYDAEDLLQRACIRALERRHQLQPGTVILSWMFSIVHTVWLNEVRARKVRNHASLQWDEELTATLVDSSCVDPETNVLHQQVIAAVARLPEAQRAVMLLVTVEGLSYREAAEVLAVPVGTVMSRLARARLTIGEAFGAKAGRPKIVS